VVKIFSSAFPFTPRSPKWAFQVCRPKLCIHFLSLHCLYSANRNSKFLRNDGTYCCQTPVIRKQNENFLLSCNWNTFVGQYVYLDNETRSIHHPSHESYVTY